MKSILSACVLVFAAAVPAYAVDNLVCQQPPPFGRISGSGIAQGWFPFRGHQTIHFCTLDEKGMRIARNVSVLRLGCWSMQLEVVPGEVRPTTYFCSSNPKDCGVGAFANIRRVSSSTPGFDVICADYTNRTDTNGDVGIAIYLPPPEVLKGTETAK